jgi:hypothetical protein
VVRLRALARCRPPIGGTSNGRFVPLFFERFVAFVVES